jgi:predicted dehydrogenase/threonine dehydrogenase-like Zn-dependent dehydrogenase
MKQIIQSLRTGRTELAEVPCPRTSAGTVLISTSISLISAGTERMLVEFGKGGWVDRIRQQPDKLRMVIDKIRTDGLLPTIEAVQSKLDQPLPMGYCNVGTVLEVGANVTGFNIGDRVVSNAFHSEVVAVSRNLCARVPAEVSDSEAVFAPLVAIALQGIRLAAPTLGEVFVVSGLGLLGLLAVQLLRAHGCRVIGTDFDPDRLALARSYGAITVDLRDATALEPIAMMETDNRGVDGVIICASTASDEPIRQAATVSRKRGRIVLIGVTGMHLSRADFYQKELTFQVSCSYGPGRYDSSYEQLGHDYPAGFVRWTAGRNLSAALNLMRERKIDSKGLISHRFPFDRASEAYEVLGNDTPSLAILLEYAGTYRAGISQESRRVYPSPRAKEALVTVGFIGAGNYADRVLLPAFAEAGVRMKAIVSNGGFSAANAARKFGFEVASTEIASVLSDPDINTVVIATRHDTHADLASRALSLGKHVFLEKPLAITSEQLSLLQKSWGDANSSSSPCLLMAGFNRRFAPHVQKIRSLLQPGPKAFVVTVNAGTLAEEHWTREPSVGGGRIIGEVCHFIDLLRYLASSPIHSSVIMPLRDSSAGQDSVTISLSFSDGSIGAVHYLANGHRSSPKEQVEIFSGGHVLRLVNFRSLVAFGFPQFSRMNLWRQDKGSKACVSAFVSALRTGGQAPIPADELFEVAALTIDFAERVRGTPTSASAFK